MSPNSHWVHSWFAHLFLVSSVVLYNFSFIGLSEISPKWWPLLQSGQASRQSLKEEKSVTCEFFCPPSITLTCGDHRHPDRTGNLIPMGCTCEGVEITYEDIDDLSICGEGTITRIWTAMNWIDHSKTKTG